MLLSEPDFRNRSVLDIGTGTGTTVQACLTEVSDLILLDKSREMLAKARENNGISRCVVADVGALPFTEGCFDVITAVGVSEYFADFSAFVSELARIGVSSSMVVFTYAPKKMANQLRRLMGHHLYLRTASDVMRMLAENKFEVTAQNRTWLQNQILMTKAR